MDTRLDKQLCFQVSACMFGACLGRVRLLCWLSGGHTAANHQLLGQPQHTVKIMVVASQTSRERSQIMVVASQTSRERSQIMVVASQTSRERSYCYKVADCTVCHRLSVATSDCSITYYLNL